MQRKDTTARPRSRTILIAFLVTLAGVTIIPGDALAVALATTPGAPTNFTATAAGATVINLAWDPPSSDGGAAVIDYYVYKSTSVAGPYTQIIFTTNEEVNVNWDLVKGTTYFFKVHARNAVGHGSNTSAVSATTWKEPTAPLNPSASRAVAAGTDRTDVTLSWSPPSNNGGTAVTAYTVGINTDPSAPSWSSQCGWVGSSPCTETQVGQPGETYYFWIAACNPVGCGPWSTSLTVAMFNYPNAPATPTVTTGLNPGELGVSWSTPSSDRPIDEYIVYRGATTTGSFGQVHAGTGLSWTEGGLGNGATWCYKIQAHSEVGYGPLSGAACGITLRAPGAPQNLQAVPGIDRTFLHWQAGDAGDRPVTLYRVQRVQANAPAVVQESPLGPLTVFTEEVPGGITYTYSVAAQSTVGIGPYSNTAAVTPFGAGTGTGGGDSGWSTRQLANVDNQTVVPDLPGGSVATIHVYNQSSTLACVDVTVNSVRQNVVCWARGVLGPLDAEIDRGDTPVGGSVTAATLSIRAEYRFNGPRLWHVAGAGGGAADAFAPVASGDAEWWANSGTQTAFKLYATLWSNGAAVRQEILTLPYLGQALAAAEYSAGTQ